MITAKKSLKQKNSEKIVFLEKCFFNIFCFRTFLLQWCLFDLLCKMYQKSENAGHMRPGPWKSCNPRAEKCHATPPPPPVLTWHPVRRGGGRGPLTWQPIAQNWRVPFNLSKKVNLFILLIANFAGNINNIETYCVNRDCVDGPATLVEGGEKGYAISRPRSHVTWAARFIATWGREMTWKKRDVATRVKSM